MIFRTDLFKSLVCKYTKNFLYQEVKISQNNLTIQNQSIHSYVLVFHFYFVILKR